MIKINLLPVTRTKKSAPGDEARIQILLGVAVLIVVLGACGYRWLMLTEEIAQQTAKKEAKTVELASLKKKVAEVDDYEKKKKLLEDKNRIIEQLRKNQGGPVRLLDYVSQSLDPYKVWLTGLDQMGAQITLDGRALSNDDVVEFVKNLQRTNYFVSVLLDESRQTTEDSIPVYQFKLKVTMKGMS